MESPTTAGTISPSVSEEAFSHMVSHIRELFTQPSVAAGALTTTFLQKTEIPDAFVGVLTTTSAHMTETTSDAFLVGAAIVKGVSFELLFVGVILVVVLVVVLVLVLCHKCKHKGTYHTNEAECGDSDSVDTYGVASQSELEILKEEE
ncbi:uncharacterized protein LOC115129659 isoform X1 [Oncorhynchus nerka]|uniref:uncharacterized protein LOC115129659 isoform X1 n=1 Tax=Oncorhynchus nerka TaxID=8023 RepID=UPI0031B7F92F